MTEKIRGKGISKDKKSSISMGISCGTVHGDQLSTLSSTQMERNEDLIVCFVMDPLDIDCKQVTFLNTKSLSKPQIEELFRILYKLDACP
mmetsp:Transcript_28498/g.69496  ORF Transcript_28498/g.69496 Transcript_28498/m.69496 type:complete len:90 (-) Transcript_28498:209-478(-)